MNERVEVLLVGETAQSSLHLTQWLERRGCRCQFSSSCKEACNLIAGQAFDFVLSHFELPDNSAYPILEKLVGSATTLFFSKLIEDGCLWIPALSQGKRWPGYFGQGNSHCPWRPLSEKLFPKRHRRRPELSVGEVVKTYRGIDQHRVPQIVLARGAA